jgi:glutathione S-transferase
MQFHLYGNRNSGHSYKVALALSLSGQNFDYTPIDLELPREARPEPFRSSSRFGEVPVLLIDDVAHCQSNAILMALNERIPGLGLAREATARALEWLFWEANRIGFSVINLRSAIGGAHKTPPDVINWLRARVASDLVTLDQELTGRRYLLGTYWSIADVACAACLYQPEHLDSEVRFPVHVAAWLERLSGETGWRDPHALLASVDTKVSA